MSLIDNAAHVLCERRLTHVSGERLPEELRPSSIADALKIQSRVSSMLNEKAGINIAGWKCLLPSDDKVVVAPIYDSVLYNTSPCPIRSLDGQAAIEPELAFVFNKTLSAKDEPYSNEEVYDAIGEVRLAFELIKSRYSTPEECAFPELLADGLFNQGLFLGQEVNASPKEIDFNLTVAGDTQTLEGKHPNGDPKAPLCWLVNYLLALGHQIEKGQAVITGSFAGVINVLLNEEVEFEYKGLGRLNVEFCDIEAK